MVNAAATPDGILVVATGLSPVVSLPAGSSAVGAGTVWDTGACHSYHSLVVTTSAGVTAGVVALQASLDGVNWFAPPGTATVTTSTASATSAVVVTCPARWLRAAITTAISGGTVTVSLGTAG